MKTLFLLVLICLSVGLGKHTIEEVHKALGIPPDAKHILMFGQASHLDWDWLNWFPTNVNNNPKSVIDYWGPSVQPTDTIFSQATQNLQNAEYGYSVCEMGFLRRFWIDHPDLFKKMISSPGTLAIVGGGITSPDNLLPHGEAFIRDYLVGISWLKEVNVTWGGKVWLPDDFGHDSQLPVLLKSLGVSGVSFSRLPGACNQGRDPEPSGSISAHRVVLNEQTGGLDFWWDANDGSSSFTYYMPDGYCSADGLYSSGCVSGTPEQEANCQCTQTKTVNDRIEAYIGLRKPLSATPYIYQAVGCDFTVPLPNLLQALNDWNTQRYPSTGVYAVSSTFEHYVDLVTEYLEKNGNTKIHRRNFHGSDASTTFKPTPYWMGFYVSRVSNKQHHYETTRALMFDEVFLSVANALDVYTGVTNEQIKQVWNLTAPSTHHDYITGTATDYVFLGEQTPILQGTTKQSKAMKNLLMKGISAAINNGKVASPHVLAFNQNGFPVDNALVTLRQEEIDEETYQQMIALPNFQVAANGDLLTEVNVPSFGYSATRVSSAQREDFVPVTVSSTEDNFVLSNAYLQAEVRRDANWAITFLLDKRSNKQVLKNGNVINFRNDNGNIYRFGYEEGCGFNDWAPTIQAQTGVVVEKGPLRTVVSAGLTVSTKDWTRVYQLTYALHASEPFMRISLTGSAANFTTVFTNFNFAENIANYDHGTTYHWDNKEPFPYGLQNDFKVTIEAAHDFFIPKANGNALAAIYHNSTPSWGVLQNSVVGALLRNSPSNCAGKGAAGHDAGSYTVHYAIRVPTALAGAETGQPLREALSFNTRVEAMTVDHPDFATVPSSFSLASVTPASAILTVAKPGEYKADSTVFRVYQASNKPTPVVVSLSSKYKSTDKVQAVTSLEEPLGSAISYRNNQVSYNAQYALTSFQVNA